MSYQSAYLDVQHGSREQLVQQHAGLVKRIAYHLITRLPASVDVEDLIQAGMIGLLEAGSNYRPGQGASFETFASIRIRGAMIDQLRQDGWAPRSISKQLREMSEAVHRLEGRLGREAQAHEIAAEMGVSLDEYYRVLQDSSSVRLCSLDQAGESGDEAMEISDDATATPADNVAQAGFQQALAAQIDGLPEREKLVMALYYQQELNLKEIGEVLEVSESRVSQIHSQAIVRLKGRLRDWLAAG